MINRMIRSKRKKAKYPDKKFTKRYKPLGKKTAYTSVNCLRVFGFYISILLFMSSTSSKLNFKGTLRSNAKVPFRGFRGRFAIDNGFNL